MKENVLEIKLMPDGYWQIVGMEGTKIFTDDKTLVIDLIKGLTSREAE